MKQLTLNEKLVRKGRSVGLPYIGSKRRVSRKLAQIFKENFFNGDTPPEGVLIYDVFGGGGAVSLECSIQGWNVIYNDYDPMIGKTLQYAMELNPEEYGKLILSRQEFLELKAQPQSPHRQLALLILSYGNKMSTYLYGEKYAGLLYELNLNLYKETGLAPYRQTKTFKDFIPRAAEIGRMLDRGEIIQRLNSIKRIYDYGHTKGAGEITFLSKDYKDLDTKPGSLLYLDPPYENSTCNQHYGASLDYREFLDWAVEKSKDNIVLLSGYRLPDDRFETVFEFKTAKTSMQSGTHASIYEKLFMVKGGKTEF